MVSLPGKYYLSQLPDGQNIFRLRRFNNTSQIFSPAARNKHLPKYFSPAALQQFSNIFRLRRATNTYRNILRLRRFTSSQVFFVCGATTLLKYFSPAAYNHLSIKYFRLWHTINTNLNYFSNLKYFSPAALQHTYQIFFNTAPPLPPSPNFERHW